jgi:two-component system LytT family sensor kinase
MEQPMAGSNGNRLPKWFGFAVASFVVPLLGLHSLLLYVFTDDKTSWLDQFLHICGTWYLWAAFFPLIAWLARRWPLIPGKMIRNALALACTGAVIACAHELIQTLFNDWLLQPAHNWNAVRNVIHFPFASALLSRYFVYLSILIVTISFEFGRKARGAEVHASQLEAEIAQAEVETLKRKLEPEKLFVNLKKLSLLMSQDVDEAESMIAEMGDDLRARLVPLPFIYEGTSEDFNGAPTDLPPSEFSINANPARNWLIIIAIFTVLAAYFLIQRIFIYARAGIAMNWSSELLNCTGWYIWALITPVVLQLSEAYPIQQIRWLKNTVIHSVALVTLWFVATVAMAIVRWAANLGDPGFLQTLLPMIARSPLWLDIVCYSVIVAVERALWYRHRFNVESLRSNQLSAQLSRAKLQALKMQLHPHFLFNSLNSLSELIREDPEAAREMIRNLETFLHLTVSDSDHQVIPFQQELEFLNCYLSIENVRYQDRLSIEMNVEPQSLNVPVPNLLLQPIVENAIRHGIASRSTPGRIEIHAKRENGDLKVSVQDNGPGLRKSGNLAAISRAGLGLSNTKARLLQLYGDRHRFELTDAPGGGLIVSLEIPVS